ncbi:MAG TPA: hypothetical protein PKA02_03385 [Candidatus Saccharibacteria bacterium]|nr:hypothetical protein [Candidatus Saccharibacteria bacterium]
MKRPEIDFSVLAVPPNHAEQLRLCELQEMQHEAIGAQVNRMTAVVAHADRQRGRIERPLTQFSSEINAHDDFVRHAALLTVLGRFGVLDQYFEAPALDTPRGWNLRLQRPKHDGVFKIAYTEEGATQIKPKSVYRAVYLARSSW